MRSTPDSPELPLWPLGLLLGIVLAALVAWSIFMACPTRFCR